MNKGSARAGCAEASEAERPSRRFRGGVAETSVTRVDHPSGGRLRRANRWHAVVIEHGLKAWRSVSSRHVLKVGRGQRGGCDPGGREPWLQSKTSAGQGSDDNNGAWKSSSGEEDDGRYGVDATIILALGESACEQGWTGECAGPGRPGSHHVVHLNSMLWERGMWFVLAVDTRLCCAGRA